MSWDPGRDVVDDLLLDPLISVMAASPVFVIAKLAAFIKLNTLGCGATEFAGKLGHIACQRRDTTILSVMGNKRRNADFLQQEIKHLVAVGDGRQHGGYKGNPIRAMNVQLRRTA